MEPHVTVCLAPSRSLRRLIPEDELVDRAAAFKEVVYPGILPDQTATFDGSFVNYDVMYDNPHWSSYVRHRLTLRETGYVELYWPVGDAPIDPQAKYTLDVAEVLAPAWRLLQAVDAGMYRRTVLGSQSRSFGKRRRADYRVFVTSGCVMAEGQTVQWTGLTFPGRKPEGRATNGRGAYESTGLAHRQLWGVKQHGAAVRVIGDIAKDLLRQCQFHGTDDAVRDIVLRMQDSDEIDKQSRA
jgi:hypothetical protein